MTDIKNAATIVLIRKKGSKYFLLLGKRVPTVAFMPSKYVFPGGSWEILDNDVPVIKRINIRDRLLLSMETEFAESANLGVTAIRELWEETGLRLSSNGQCNNSTIAPHNAPKALEIPASIAARPGTFCTRYGCECWG